MRAGLSTIQQTLTPEAASVLNHSIAEAARRNHSQTTPLHVAATLLASPTGYLRQACIKSHPNSSHPLQCRALELCFSVALERLPTTQTTTGTAATDPPISNALMAALKRAQAHQRRGCPEQQQQPLLAVKVELEQLIISILDDPSVSRVMREASFSSPAVKATIEHSINCSNTSNSNTTPGACPNSVPPVAGLSNSVNNPIGLPFRPQGLSKNLYLSPRLQGGGTGGGGGIAGGVMNSSVNSGPGQSRLEEIKRVGDVLMREKKRNPVLVGESEPQAVVKELLRRIENNELGGDQGGFFKNVQVVRLDKEFASDKAMISGKLKELGDVVEARIGNLGGGGVIIDLGDLKWLVEQPVGSGSGTGSAQVGSEKGKIVVTEMAKLLARFSEGSGSGSDSGRLWLIGTATCETYLRCQVYHPTMEADWDLQAMPIAARASLPGLFPRLGANGTLKPSLGSPSPLKSLSIINPAPLHRLSENSDQSRKPSCCPECAQKLEQELAKLAATEFESTSPEVKSEAARPTLPQWLQNAKINDGEAKSINNSENKEQEGIRKQKTQELQKKWNETCLHSHPQFHQRNIGPERITAPHALTGLYNPSLLLKQPLHPKLNRNLGDALQLSSNTLLSQTPEQPGASPPRSPVRTDLVLGQPKLAEPTVEKPLSESVKDFLGVLSSEPQIKVSEFSEKLLGKADADSYKKLLKGLADKVWWQHDAASAVASAMTQCKLGNGKKRGLASKGDIWLLFTGPDRVGKKKMASALADLVCGASPIMISFGSRCDGEECNRSFRGKTALDRIAEAVRWNPFSVIMLEDIDEADMLVRGSIKRAIERGRIADSHGREISLGNVTIILSVSWLPDNLKSLSKSITLDEEKLESLASTAWQLRLSLCERTAKRRANWLHEEERFTKPRKDTSSGFGFDLNEAADVEDDRGDGSRNSSDLTVDSDIDHGIDKRRLSTMSLVYNEFVGHVDDSIVFNPVDFAPIVQDTKDSIVKAFSSIIGNRVSIEVQDEAVQKILGGVWVGNAGLEEWTESVLIPSFHLLRARLPSTIGMLPDESTVVRLESRSGDSGKQKDGNWLPSTVVVEGV